MTAPRLRLLEGWLGIRTALSRMPFRYGAVTVRTAPVATLEVAIETEDGRRATGYAADFLAYRWFDKRPQKTLVQNVADLLRAIDLAVSACRARRAYRTAFELWLTCSAEVSAEGGAADLNDLTQAFGVSMPERAVIDALGRLLHCPVAELLAKNALGIDLARLDPDLSGIELKQVIANRPLDSLWIRHTVGLLDPITGADVPEGGEVRDGLPETLEGYLQVDGLRFLKIKLCGRLAEDIDRLMAIAALLSKRALPCAVTLDGNEQYRDFEAFAELMGRLRATPALKGLEEAILFIEQPLERSVALSSQAAPLLRRSGGETPIIIDEADGTLDAFRTAMALGYRGVSHKNCKGVVKSLLNLARVRRRNAELGGAERYFLSAEDLTTLPIVPLQSDLAMVALLGIAHVERNGHHYFFGLDHLPPEEQAEALTHHPDLYVPFGRKAILRIREGALELCSLQVPGMGFIPPPRMASMSAPQTWLAEHASDESLGS